MEIREITKILIISMELSETLYNWLRSTSLFDLPPPKGSFYLPDSLAESLESGLGFVKLIKRINQLKVTVIQNNLNRLATPLPKLNTLKQASTPSVKLYNWKIIFEALELYGFNIDMDFRSLIIAGDRDMVVDLLRQIHEAEKLGFKDLESSAGKKETGVDLEELDNEKSLLDSTSIVEYFVLSLSRSLEIRPKQSTGLLTQSGKPLALIIGKGLKGNFEPVRLWLQEVYASTEKLSGLICDELDSGSTGFVLSVLKPGMISKDKEVLQWTIRVFSRLILDLTEKNLLPEVWKWFVSENFVEICVLGVRNSGKDAVTGSIDLLLQIGQYNYIEFFTLHLKNVTSDDSEYMGVVLMFVDQIEESESLYEEIVESGIVSYWAEMAIKDIQDALNVPKLATMAFLVKVITGFSSVFEENESLMNSILSIFNRIARNDNNLLKTASLGMMFYLFEFLAEEKSMFAPILYRTLTFILVETYATEDLRELIQRNFTIVFRSNKNIPIGILMDPYIKRLQVSDVNLEVFDYDFLSDLAQYPALSLKNSIQLIDIIGKNYLNELAYSKLAGVPFTHLASRYIQQSAMQEYLYVYMEYCINLVISTEKTRKSNKKVKPNIEEKVQQRNRILDMLCWIIQQWQDSLNNKLKDLLLKSNHLYHKSTSADCKGITIALDLLGDSSVLLQDFQDLNPTLYPAEPESLNNYQLVPVKELAKRSKGNFPWERISEDIEKAKRRKQEKDNKIREEEIKQQKALDYKKKKLRQQLEVRKLEHGVGKEEIKSLVYAEGVAQRLMTHEEIILKEFSPAEADFEEGVKMMMNKYSRVFKLLFSKYSGTGFEKKNHVKSDFQKHAERKWKLNDAEYIKMMKDFKAIPKLMNKEELRAIMRTYNHKIAKQAEQSYVDYKGFKGVFCQIAFHVYSKRPHDYSHLPPIVSLRFFLDFLRDSWKSQDISTEMFDEPDPGTGDKDVVKSLNKQLLKDPKAVLPEGYEKIADREINVFFSIPQNMSIPVSFRYSVEILDSVLFKSTGMHILEPQIEYFTSYRAKGIAAKKEPTKPSAQVFDRLFESKKAKPVQEIPAPRDKTPPPVIAKVEKLSPVLQSRVSLAPVKLRPALEEVAWTLENVLMAVEERVRLLLKKEKNKNASPAKGWAKVNPKPEDTEKKAEDEKKRKARQEKLLEEISRAKEARQLMLQEEEEKRRNQAIIEGIKNKVLQEKLSKEKDEKRKKLQEWVKKREEAGDSGKEKEESKLVKPKASEGSLKQLVITKKTQEKLMQVIKAKEKSIKKQKQQELLRIQKEIEEKKEKKERAIRSLLENQAKDEQKPVESKKEFIRLLSSNEIKVYISNYLDQIGDIFSFYLHETSTSSNGSMEKTVFSNFCSDFDLHSIASKDICSQVFDFLTKKKSIPVISFEEFQKSLILIANKAKESLDVAESGVKPIEKLFESSGISNPIKAVKKKIKGLREIYNRDKPVKKRARPLSLINAAKNISGSYILGRNSRKALANDSRNALNKSRDNLDSHSSSEDY